MNFMSTRCFSLILFLLIIWGKSHVKAQKHNGEIYQSLIQGFFEKEGNTVGEVEGNLVKNWFPTVVIDSSLVQKLIIGGVDISYKKHQAGNYERTVSMQLTLQDSVMRAFPLSYKDTLSLPQIRQIRRKSPLSLRGDLPTATARLVKPFVVVGLSVAGIVSLFYLRSR